MREAYPYTISGGTKVFDAEDIRDLGKMLAGGREGERSAWEYFMRRTRTKKYRPTNYFDTDTGTANAELVGIDPDLPISDIERSAIHTRNTLVQAEELLHGLDHTLVALGHNDGILKGTWAAQHWSEFRSVVSAATSATANSNFTNMSEAAVAILFEDANRKTGNRMPQGFLDLFTELYPVRTPIRALGAMRSSVR